jgi:hypothetical protein
MAEGAIDLRHERERPRVIDRPDADIAIAALQFEMDELPALTTSTGEHLK